MKDNRRVTGINLSLKRDIYEHIEELAIQSHITIETAIECLLHQDMEKRRTD